MTDRPQHPAVDHLRKFLDEEFVLGDGGHVQASAFLRSYEYWCEGRDVKHRRLTPIQLLDAMATTYGVTLKNCRTLVDGDERFVIAISPIRFRHDEGLNWRLRYPGVHQLLREEIAEVRRKPRPQLHKQTDEERRAVKAAKAREWYQKHKAKRQKETDR
jgi:hypothetical protein